MKNKFLTIALSLMLCLSSMFIFGACKDEPVPVPEAAAMETFNTAMTNMENEDAVKMTYSLMGYELSMVASEEQIYMYSTDTIESWSVKNGEVFDQYTIVNVSTSGTPEYEYVKSIVPAVEATNSGSLNELFDELIGEDLDLTALKFAKASKLNGELTIKFDIVADEDMSLQYIFKIKDDKLVSISMEMMGMTMSFKLSYGASLLEEIPERPTLDFNNQPIVWDEYEPKIEVEGIPSQFEVGDTLNLDEIELEFYVDATSFDSEDYDITLDMITGFDTTTATEEGHPRTMTITFCGLTYQVQYTVTAPAAAE